MNENVFLGIGFTAVPLLVFGYLLLRRQPSVFRMFAAMVLIGIGYLWATGAMEDIGRSVASFANPETVTAPETPATAPVTNTAPVADPAPAPTTPPPVEAQPAPSAPVTSPDAAPATP